MLTTISIISEIVLLKYSIMSWLDSIQASGVMAPFAALIELTMKLIFGK